MMGSTEELGDEEAETDGVWRLKISQLRFQLKKVEREHENKCTRNQQNIVNQVYFKE